jgi:hypothetical protein
MKGFSVDPTDLHAAARKLSALDDGLDEQIALRYSMNPREVGHKDLELQIDEFQQRLAAAVARLRDDVQETSARLRLTATTYEESETARASVIDL